MVSKRDEENDNLSKGDLDTILEVNKKAIEVQVEVASQNENIIEELEESKELKFKIIKDIENVDRKIDYLKIENKEYHEDNIIKISELSKKVDDFALSQAKIYFVLTAGGIATILQLIQIILNWKK